MRHPTAISLDMTKFPLNLAAGLRMELLTSPARLFRKT